MCVALVPCASMNAYKQMNKQEREAGLRPMFYSQGTSHGALSDRTTHNMNILVPKPQQDPNKM